MGRLPTKAEDRAWNPVNGSPNIPDPVLHAAIEAEKNVLGSILYLPEILPEVKSIVRPADFVHDQHRTAYREILEIDRAGLPISLAMLTDRLRGAKEFQGTDQATYWFGVTDSVVSAVHASMYAGQIVEARRKRQRVTALEDALHDANNGHTSERIDQMLFATVDDWRREREAVRQRDTYEFSHLLNEFPKLKPVLIEGLLRVGETCNVIAPTKVGKSWFGYHAALSVITGRYIVGRFQTYPGRVLIVDNELHAETLSHRIPLVASAMGLSLDQYGNDLVIKTVRGNLRSFEDMAAEIRDEYEPGYFSLVEWDAKYRLSRPGQSENDNAAEAMFYNEVDAFNAAMQCASMFIHHSTKGSQSEKRVSDIGAGGGAQSRAADCHCCFREHEEDGVFVFDALVRSFAPVESIPLRWKFPMWVADDDVDPSMLKGKQTRTEERQNEKDRQGISNIVDAIRKDGPGTPRQLRGRTGLSRERQQRLLDQMASEGQLSVTTITIRGNETNEYSLPTETE